MDADRFDERLRRLESQVAWLVRQVRKILRVLGLGGEETVE
jgi:hypothetical protein